MFGGSALSFRNKIINGNFLIWQRGTTFSSPASYAYTADRWLCDGAATSVTRAGTQNNVLTIVTQAGTGIAQRVETQGGNFYAGNTYTVSALVNPSVADLTIIVTYRAGNTFKSTIHNANVSSQLTAGQYRRVSTTFTLANAPTDFAGTDCIQVSFISSVVNTINLQEVQMEAGSVVTPFENRPIGTELALCQRYYEKSYDIATVPGTATSSSLSVSNVVVRTDGTWVVYYPYKVTKRALPSTSVAYTAAGTINTISARQNEGAFSNIAVNGLAGEGGVISVGFYGSGTASARFYAEFHWTASAEL